MERGNERTESLREGKQRRTDSERSCEIRPRHRENMHREVILKRREA